VAVDPDRDLGIYLHVPFCRVHCPYCDFYTYPAGRGRQDEFVDALLTEIALAPARLRPGRHQVPTVYFGGGTPSVLSEAQIGRIIEALRGQFDLSPDCEITLEANPRDISEEFLAGVAAAGVNRLSLGIQSFLPAALEFLGRDHDPREVRRSLELLRSWQNWSADLIFGWHGQTAALWEEDLVRLLACAPPHVSLYQLTFENKTRLGVLADLRRVPRADLDLQGELYRQAQQHLAAAGLEQYEISSFARPGLRSRHNMRYWRRLPYLGLGPAASSHLDERRTENVRSLPRYLRSLGRRTPPVVSVEVLSPQQIARERVWLGLRTTEGIPVDWLPPGAWRLIEESAQRDLVFITGNRRLVLLPSGMAIADEFAARLLRVMEM
jgi:oxygen-independent coproporphyrinogen-3 oxidase